MLKPRSFLSIAAVTFALQAIFAYAYITKVPLWMPSDESAHMRYIIRLAQKHSLPVVSDRPFVYECHQTPLFYTTAACVYSAIQKNGDRVGGYAVRWYCYLLHVVTTLIVSACLFMGFRHQRNTALAASVFFALNPALLAIACSVSNDSLTYLIGAVWALALIKSRYKITEDNAFIIGIICALGLLSKLTFAPICLLSGLLCLRQRRMTAVMAAWVKLIIPVALMLGPWLLFNYCHYGALTAQHAFFDKQTGLLPMKPAADILHVNWKAFIAYHFLPTEFWHNEIPLPLAMKLAVTVSFFFAVVGGVLSWKRQKRENEDYAYLRFCSIVYAAGLVVWLYANLTVEQGAIRWVFASYFAFASLLLYGLSKLFCLTNRPALVLFPLISLAAANLVLCSKLQLLMDYGDPP